jgi:ribosomal protection tetracycline resistance protein
LTTSRTPCLNLGIVAHVDAGKTSLTERLLYDAGVIDAPGSVDAGTTRTDSMDLERRRGITIRAAVTSFAIDELAVNLVDTPGHPDFIAEVERSLTVLDAAVLVLSSVEGVQPQTVVIWRALQRVGVPAALFVNKVDRSGSDVAAVVEQVRRRLTAHVVPLARPVAEGSRDATVVPVPPDDDAVVEAVADVDDRVLAGWVAGSVPVDRVCPALRRGTRDRRLTPLLCGSALTGVGVPLLRDLVHDVLPRARSRGGGAVSGTVFAVDRDERGRRAWVRLWSGEVRVRDRLRVDGAARPVPVTEVGVSAPGGVAVRRSAGAGQIVALRGPEARIGDVLGRPPRRRTHRFPPATLQALVEPEDPAQRVALFAGLTELAEEDPLIDLRIDDVDGEAALSLHGEVQKEVVGALLEERYGVRARFAQTSTVCLERVVGTGCAEDLIGRGGNPYLAGIGLRVEAAPVGHGVEFSPGIERGNLPAAFVTATEDGVRQGLRQGPHGWQVTDLTVTMTSSAYYPRQSRPHQKFDKASSTVAGDFRHLAPVVLAAALAQAGTLVCRPVDRFELDLPEQALSQVAALLGRLGAVVLETTATRGDAHLVGHLPSARVPDLASRLPDLTGGEAVLVSRLDHHAPVPGAEPTSRRRRGPDPADREAWFRDVPR